jgi:hypothetical protein
MVKRIFRKIPVLIRFITRKFISFRKISPALFFFLFIILNASAQPYYNDAQLRTNLGLSKHITSKLSLSFDQQYRWNKNISEHKRSSFDIGISYKLHKNISVKADYVYIQRRKNEGYEQLNWYYIGIILKHKAGYWKFAYRNLLQARMSPKNSDEYYIMRYYDRNKFSISYELSKRYTLSLEEELYIPLNNPQVKGIDRSRSFLRMNMKTFKNQSIELYFMYQAQLQRGKWFDQNYRYTNRPYNRDYIYGINYQIDL